MAEVETKTTEVEEKEQEKETKTTDVQTEKKEQSVDVEKVKSDAVADLLKTLGVEDSYALKSIVSKAKEEEDKNKTDLEKSNDALSVATKELAEERKSRIKAEAGLVAVKLGAKPELVDDLIVVAMSKVTKDKDINTVIAEIKDSTNGKIYFVSDNEKEEKKQKEQKTTVTRKRVSKTKEETNDNETKSKYAGTMAERLLANRKPVKSHYFK